MKCICPVCMAELEVSNVMFNGEKVGFKLTPEHQPQKGAVVKISTVVDQRTGRAISSFCDGSLRPLKNENLVQALN